MARPTVALFVTCLVDLMRPAIGFAAVKLLEAADCEVVVPPGQTCCGQPAYNGGEPEAARAVARQVIAAFERFDYVVAPSGSCAGMIRVHYPRLFEGDPAWEARAQALAARTHELTQFLAAVVVEAAAGPPLRATATYHDSCSGLRELGIKAEPRALLAKIPGLVLKEGAKAETCCGFGGAFCVKYPDVAAAITDAKLDDLQASGAELVLGGDLGCLLAIAGRAQRLGLKLDCRHVAEVLAGTGDTPPIGA